MTVKAVYGFENQVLQGDGEYSASGAPEASLTSRTINGNGGAGAVNGNATFGGVVSLDGPQTSEVKFEFSWHQPASGNSESKVSFVGGTDIQFALYFDIDTGCIGIYKGQAPTQTGTRLATSLPVLSRDKDLVFHVHALCDAAVGFCHVYMGGNTTDPVVTTGVNADTRQSLTGPAELQAILVTLGKEAILDDVVVIDPTDGTDFLGGALFIKRTVVSVGTDNGFTPSAGTNATAVAPVPPTSTDTSSSAVDLTDQTFVMSAMPAWVGTVVGTVSRFYGNHQGPTLTGVQERVRDGGTTDNSAETVTLSFATGYSSAPFRTLDANGVAWTPASAEEFGFTVVSP